MTGVPYPEGELEEVGHCAALRAHLPGLPGVRGAISLRSPPAQNVVPVPVTMTTQTSGSALAAASAPARFVTGSALRELARSGRLSRRMRTRPSEVSTSTGPRSCFPASRRRAGVEQERVQPLLHRTALRGERRLEGEFLGVEEPLVGAAAQAGQNGRCDLVGVDGRRELAAVDGVADLSQLHGPVGDPGDLADPLADVPLRDSLGLRGVPALDGLEDLPVVVVARDEERP